jgi:hypothetical protein
VLVDRDATALGQLHADLVEIEASRERLAAHGNEDQIAGKADLLVALNALQFNALVADLG